MLNVSHLARIDLNLLTLFQAVLEEGHVGRAAWRLNLTPSAVSHGLKRLRALLNDPLFLRTPKGVVPTERAVALAAPIADILARAASVLETAAPFDPASTRRRFMIGAPDALLAAFIAPSLARLSLAAPFADFGLVHLMPSARGAGDAWGESLKKLEARALDVAVLPLPLAPPRFSARPLYEEDFVVAMRGGHPFADKPTLAAFCAASHVLVSMTGDPHGFVDALLAKRRRERRIAVTAPSFMMAMAQIADSDLLGVLPRRLVRRYSRIFGLASAELPLKRPPDPIAAVTSNAALMDAGVAWLVDALAAIAIDQPASGAL